MTFGHFCATVHIFCMASSSSKPNEVQRLHCNGWQVLIYGYKSINSYHDLILWQSAYCNLIFLSAAAVGERLHNFPRRNEKANYRPTIEDLFSL